MWKNIFVFVIVFLFISPQLIFQQFSLLDIIETVSFGHFSNYSNLYGLLNNLNEYIRFRPLFILERIMLNSIFSNVQQYFLFIALILGSTLIISKSIIEKNKQLTYQTLSLLLILTLLSPITIDAYWRLGTAENLLTFLLLLSLYCLLSGRYVVMTISNILLILCKETAIAYLPIFAVATFIKQKYVYTVIQLILIIIILPILASKVHIALFQEVYTSMFTNDLTKNVKTGFTYLQSFPQLTILFLLDIYLLILGISAKKQKLDNNFIHYVFIICIVISFFVILVFENIQAYYLLPIHFLLVTLFLYEFQSLTDNKIRTFLTIFVVIIVLTNFPSIKERVRYWQNDYAADQPLLQYLETTQSTYSINLHNRVDHILAFKYVLGNKYESDISKAEYEITREYKGILSEEDKLFCSYNFFGEKICKWYLIK